MRALSAAVFSFSLVVPSLASAAPWIVSAASAKKALTAGALLLDARPPGRYQKGHLRGAINVHWQHLTKNAPKSERGVLLGPSALGKKIARLGLSKTRRILVIGDAKNGWGEDGWLVWLLRATGHREVSLVDGGHQALKTSGLTTTTRAPSIDSQPVKRAILSRRLTSRLGQVRRHVEQARKNNPLLIDSREPREFKGATPYGETRGGHLPGAINLHYRALLDARGRLLPRSRLRAKLGKLGIKKSQPLIIYCTGGVRSGWLTVVLAHLGYRNVKNYPGSMWQWAARDAKTHPLVK